MAGKFIIAVICCILVISIVAKVSFGRIDNSCQLIPGIL